MSIRIIVSISDKGTEINGLFSYILVYSMGLYVKELFVVCSKIIYRAFPVGKATYCLSSRWQILIFTAMNANHKRG